MKMGKVLGTLANGILTICAVVVTVLVIRQEFFKPPTASAPPPTNVTNWRAYAEGGHRFGPDNAPVAMIVFSDFQCPACRLLAAHIKALQTEFPRELAIIHRHAPTSSTHSFAVDAARASECAAQQGRFSAFHDALFVDQTAIGLVPWTRFAVNAGIPDVAAFSNCVTARAPSRTLDSDTLAAKELKLTGTPTLLINGLRFTGTPPLETLRAVVTRAVETSAK